MEQIFHFGATDLINVLSRELQKALLGKGGVVVRRGLKRILLIL